MKKAPVEFYMLFDDYTWDTTIIDIPLDIINQYIESDIPNYITDWAYKNEKFSGNVSMIGIYSLHPMENSNED